MAHMPGLRNKEVCLMCQWVLIMELVDTYTLNLFSKMYNKNQFCATKKPSIKCHVVNHSTLSTLSFNEKVFQEALPFYQKAFQNSGYNHTFT